MAIFVHKLSSSTSYKFINNSGNLQHLSDADEPHKNRQISHKDPSLYLSLGHSRAAFNKQIRYVEFRFSTVLALHEKEFVQS